MCALFILIEQTKLPLGEEDSIIQLYLRNTAFINNRDLVDLSAPIIVGGYYFDKDRSKLYQLASSPLLRDRRISILATFYFIKHGQYTDTFQLAKQLLHDTHDLIQKAVGRMLREVGKRGDLNLLRGFLNSYAHQMPRTMLRYSIEKFPLAERKSYLLR
jgi:3-methyladenine DNA glycosylase AlkD